MIHRVPTVVSEDAVICTVSAKNPSPVPAGRTTICAFTHASSGPKVSASFTFSFTTAKSSSDLHARMALSRSSPGAWTGRLSTTVGIPGASMSVHDITCLLRPSKCGGSVPSSPVRSFTNFSHSNCSINMVPGLGSLFVDPPSSRAHTTFVSPAGSSWSAFHCLFIAAAIASGICIYCAGRSNSGINLCGVPTPLFV